MTPPSEPIHDPMVGVVIDDRYRITGQLGAGAMGAVYRCENTRLHARPCAMKVLSGLGTPQEQARFEREVRTISQLRSVHTVLVFDSGRLEDGRPYIVMELLEGRELGDALAAGGAFALDRAVRVADQVLTALIEAHDLGIVHRDLKPANLFLVSDGDAEIAKVLDFGIAKQLGDASPALTRKNASMGTPRYMSPEQYRDEDATPRTDLYSLGVVFYEMVVGRLPFHEDDPVPEGLGTMPASARLAWMHLNRTAPTVDGLSTPLAAWLARLVSKAPADRFADARSARSALRQTPEASWTPAAGPLGRPSLAGVSGSPPDAPARRWQPVVAGLAVGLVGLVALIAVLKSSGPHDESTPTASPPIAECPDTVRSDPPGARVRQGERLLGQTPLTIDRPCGVAWVLDLKLPGHEQGRLTLDGPTSLSPATVFLVPEPVEDPPDAAPAPAAKPKPTRRRTRPKPRVSPKPVDKTDEGGGPLIF